MISFDQYQRYKTISSVAEQIKTRFDISSLKIMEVGANAQKNLGKFLDKDEIFYTDIDTPDGFENDDHFFVADATNLVGISDNEYDVVVASDVFEHIPKKLRKAFITELNRVARYGVIMCFPFKAGHVCEAEVRTNDYYKMLYGEDYIWLYEHIDNGLPDREEIDTFLQEAGINAAAFEHGDIDVWEAMFRCHFYAVCHEKLIAYRENIDAYYNNNIYATDISDKNYRVFYVLYKDKTQSDFYESIKNSIFNGTGDSVAARMKLSELSVDLKDISKRIKKKQKVYTTCYYDYGMGFNEDDVRLIELPDGRQIFSVGNVNEIQSLRIDPLEGKKCLLYNVSITDDNNQDVAYVTNGDACEGIVLFDTTDPQIIVNITDDIQELSISFQLIVLNDDDVCLMERLFRIHKENAKLKLELSDANEKLEELRAKESNLSNDIDIIKNSNSWKITKPLRHVKDAIKK